MDTFLTRLVEEKRELEVRTEKLQGFIEGSQFQSIDPIQQSLLNAQIFSMKTYAQILTERISWLSKH